MGDGTEAGAPLGRFGWPEANMKDVAAAKAFYTALFGWEVRADADGGYAEWRQDGQSLGGLIGLGAEREKVGVPSHWMIYATVASADETAAKAKEHGGRVLHGPFSIPGVGRFAALQDPTGARFSLFQGVEGSRAPLQGVPVSMCWNELVTMEVKKAGAFYGAVLGWGARRMPMGPAGGDYTVFLQDGAMVGGMQEMLGDRWGDAPPHWMTYFAVEDCDATAAKAAELGGTVRVPPQDIPNIGRFAMIVDPQGAAFSVIRL